MQQNDELLSFVDKKLYSGLFLKRISEKLVDKESKVVRDRQDDNSPLDWRGWIATRRFPGQTGALPALNRMCKLTETALS